MRETPKINFTTSPLPWSIDADADIQDAKGEKVADMSATDQPDLEYIVASVNHADKLAEALREAITEYGVLTDNMPEYRRKDWDKALAAYEEAQSNELST